MESLTPEGSRYVLCCVVVRPLFLSIPRILFLTLYPITELCLTYTRDTVDSSSPV